MQEITLTQNTFTLFPTVYAVQNDTGRELKMIIQDQSLLLGDTGAVAVQRSDGSYYTIPATIQLGDNAFKADISQALTQPGRTLCQLKVTRSDLVISTYTFAIMVQPSTDGINEAQLGYSVQQLRQDAEDIRTGGLPAALRLALLQIAQKVAYIDDQGEQYYQALYDALAPSAILTGITAVYTQSGTVYDTDALDSLKADLVVTASYSDGTSETLPASAYTLSGTLEAGTSTITVTYEETATTFDVTVTANPIPSTYTAYSYIQATGKYSNIARAQHIELEEFANMNAISCEAWAKPLTGLQNTDGAAVLGCRLTSGDASSFAFYGNTDGLGYHLHGVNGNPKPSFTMDAVNHIIYTNTTASPSSLQTNDNAPVSIVWANNNTVTGHPTLFGNPVNYGTFTLVQYLQIGTIKFYDLDGNLVSDYRPVVRNADNVIGMYETISGTFYTTSTASYATIGNTNCRYKVGNW